MSKPDWVKTMFSFKDSVLPVFNDGTIRGQCPDCRRANLVYVSDFSTAVKCTGCKFQSDWVAFCDRLETERLVWVFDGREQYLKAMSQAALFLDGTCILDEERDRRGTWTPI